jgi:hypothetical protein
MASYGVQVCWEFLKVSDFAIIDSVLFIFLKRVLAVSPYTRSRLVILLTGVKLTSERLAEAFDLPWTPNFAKYLGVWENKLASIDPAFLDTPAMKNQSWTAPLANNRSAVCRHAMHGFHHAFCAIDGFHEVGSGCICHRCGETCTTYHSSSCQASPFSSIAQMAAAN